MNWLNSTKGCFSIALPLHDQNTVLRQDLARHPALQHAGPPGRLLLTGFAAATP